MKYVRRALFSSVAAMFSVCVNAGVYSDDLSKCLVKETTSADKTTLVAWIFSAFSLNPAVAPMVAISPQQRLKINGDAALLFQSLLTEKCRVEAQQAVKYEGASSLELSFNVLGQAAGRELSSSPDVVAGLGEMTRMMDVKKLEAVFGPAK